MLLVAPAARSPGRGTLVIARAAERSVIAAATSESPLKILLPRSHGDGRWAFISTFGGGLVDGDTIDLDVRIERGARALLGTQASTKVYQSPRKGARQKLTARVEEGAFLAFVPDHTTCFEDARYEQTSSFELAHGASLVTVDVLSCGRSARGERWAFSRYASRTRITRNGALLANEGIVLDPAHGDIAQRMGRFDAVATMFAFGPAASGLREAFHAAATLPLERRADLVIAASPIGEGGAVLRIAGTRIEIVTRAVQSALRDLREIFGDDPFARKW